MDFTIIDIRPFIQYQNGHIPGAKSVEAYKLLNNPTKYLKKDKVYHLYCNSGFQSKIVTEKLNSMGYNTFNIGSYHNYLLKK